MLHELLIGLRYLKARRKQTFISIITIISIGGVALGVAALIVVISVMSGFKKDLQEKILGVNAHLVISKNNQVYIDDYEGVMEEIKDVPGVVASTPYIFTQVMLYTEYDARSGAILRGIDIETAPDVISIKDDLEIGDLRDLEASNEGLPGIILGRELANLIGVYLGSEIYIMSPGGSVSPLGVTSKMKKFKVTGIMVSGMYEYDATFAYISITEAQDFLDIPDWVSGIEVKVDNIYRAGDIAHDIQTRLGDRSFFTRDWMQMNQNLFAALELEKVAMFISLVLIVLVATFNIASTLIMIVMEKNKDIAILKSIGASNGSILRIFIFEGLIIGFLGTFLGFLGGLTICFLLKRFKFIELDSSIYYMSTLPVDMVWSDILIISFASILLCFFATIYPAWQASRLDPAEALRYE